MTLRLALAAVLAIVGLAVVVFNGRKLISDWPRPKPRHNVDVAWIQVYLGLAAVAVAWVLVRNPAEALLEPTPQVVNSDAAPSNPR